MGWGPCIFRLLTVNLLTLPVFQANSMLLDGEVIELRNKKLSLSFFNTFLASLMARLGHHLSLLLAIY